VARSNGKFHVVKLLWHILTVKVDSSKLPVKTVAPLFYIRALIFESDEERGASSSFFAVFK